MFFFELLLLNAGPVDRDSDQALEKELRRIPPSLARSNADQLWSVVYLPQIGYVIQISGTHISGEIDQMQHWSLIPRLLPKRL